ncbi:bifunctional GNAT family N-acetyltransferase/class I SAM-dependent methyltransferase [Prosthecobacter sp.]|uniref:GNAT family N-acetyltransferase n=1 Tax=Prosthecobacter sp. TaxID=1965333 RepID=UPI002ABCF55B|nr:bifunctional GNAT family N-acetyltransferase/class I SAM-dependent methyltransferase [Prosthecobacter sp.]MDZ4404312.1 bifunctional GNAT family N-acetyltransferase/class I SAM-dependent methyltransferase [Prosthecobacter sp.]
MNIEHIRIRELRPDDSVAAITELLHTSYTPLAAMGFKYLATHQDEATTQQRLQGGISIVAELDGAIVGTATLRAPEAESRCAWYSQPGVWSFGQFAVRPDLQRNGLGARLMRVIERRAFQHGATELALDTAEGATHLVRWYERLGFRFIQHVSWDETNYRSVVMSKRLPDPNPWLRIPLSDYEAHMALPSVAQSQLLASTLQSIVTRFQPRSLAIFGAAGGNGLELVDSAIVRRVVALDFNPDYLRVCASRHGASFAEFQPVLHDLSQGAPAIEPVECIFAGLVLEYLRLDVFCSYLPSLLTAAGIFATVLQLPADGLPEVSVSPFPSLTQLQPAFAFVSPTHLDDLLSAQGFSRLEDERHDLNTGKSFYFVAYQLTNQPRER